MREDAVLQALGITFVPNVGDAVALHIPSLSSNPVLTFVRYRAGSVRQGKIQLGCMSGPGDAHGSIHVIWKPSTGWFCWLMRKRYDNVRVEHP